MGWSCLPKPATSDQGNRALDPTIRPFNTYRRLIRAQVPARLDRVVAEIPQHCEGERCLRLKLVEDASGALGRQTPRPRDLSAPRDRTAVNKVGEELRGELRQ